MRLLRDHLPPLGTFVSLRSVFPLGICTAPEERECEDEGSDEEEEEEEVAVR